MKCDVIAQGIVNAAKKVCTHSTHLCHLYFTPPCLCMEAHTAAP